MTTQHIETLVVGAGQAGLATAYHLQRLGRECLVVEANDRIGDNWRCHYESLRLYTPAKASGLPGLAFPGDPWSFPGKDDIAGYLEQYALQHDLPVRTGTRVTALARRANGSGFVATVGEDILTCDNVVIATGTFGRAPYVPDAAAGLDAGIRQLHSSEYARPAQLAPGVTLVVGASHSGCDIAYEVAAERPTILVGRDTGRIPVSWESRGLHVVLPVMFFAWRHVLTRRTPVGRRMMKHVRHHGGPMLRVKREHLAARGVEWIEARVVGVTDGLPRLDDGRVLDIANVVWCTGFRQDFGWIDLPVVGEDGWPTEYRGVVETEPGLFFCGLAFQYSMSSTVLPGVGRDAEYLARRIAAPARHRVRVGG
ncbi:flavin-containing monooxygenase [Promicromonospora panici]|uniref:flavin-containing monooxygenase n=1 Tax=Promicromonospora panici TaxID=2219658 RepID=UPI00101C3812|nr:NAD(P)/FAD-dependent oxidoreductase [Promicromonospora panici]